jgi:hypothetical protein
MAQPRDERSLGELLSELLQESSTLVRQEVQLAKAELSQNAAEAGRAIASMVVGGAVIYAGLLAIIAAAILGLGEAGLPWWLAALVVGVAVAVVGALLVSRARSALKEANLAPSQTVESLKEDREWVKEQVT